MLRIFKGKTVHLPSSCDKISINYIFMHHRRGGLIEVFPVCHSVYIVWTYYPQARPLCAGFRLKTFGFTCWEHLETYGTINSDASEFGFNCIVFITLCTYLHFIQRVTWKIGCIAKCCNNR